MAKQEKNKISQRELARRAKQSGKVDLENNGGWDDLNNLYLECSALSLSPVGVSKLLKDKNALATVKDTEALKSAASVLAKDVASFNSQLTEIYNKHKARTGNAGPEELLVVLSLGEEYHNWLTNYQQVVLPVIADITALFDTSSVDNTEPTPDNKETSH
ncbi:MAG: hypothetical protein IBX57_00325 [Gammaproteobacteria bacterium]|nr:hypothetical protein [Gammaproteobacteria bacterium]